MSRTTKLVVALSLISLSCGASRDEQRERVAKVVRGNLEKACNGQPECLQAIDENFDACLDEYIAATERDGAADPNVMAQCMNTRSGKEWFGWREKTK